MALDPDSAGALVLEFLRARLAFEFDASHKFERAKEDRADIGPVMDEIQAAYDSILRTYCTPSVQALELRANFGNPPTVHPEAARIESIKPRGKALVVTASEPEQEPTTGPPWTVQYVVELFDDRYLLADRRVRRTGERWISLVF